MSGPVELLVASLLALGLGPLIHLATRRRQGVVAFLDGFVLVTIAGTVTLAVAPRVLGDGDWIALAFLLAGWLGPGAVERLFHHAARRAHAATLAVAVVGLCFHQVLDGTVFSLSTAGSERLLPLAVVLHQIPVGLGIWWALRDNRMAVPAGLLGLMMLSTVLGYFLGPDFSASLPDRGIGWFESLIGGSLLHVLIHSPHADEAGALAPGDPRHLRNAGIGSLLGVAVLVALVYGGVVDDRIFARNAVTRLADMAFTVAPMLLLALALSSGLSLVIGKKRYPGGMFASAFVPASLKSVALRYRVLVRSGVGVAGAIAFLAAAPELGIDSILLSIPLLGVDLTLVRIAAALAIAVGAAALFHWWVGADAAGAPVERHAAEPDHSHEGISAPASVRSLGALRRGLEEAVDQSAPWIVIGLVVAALLEPSVIARYLAALPRVVEVVALAALGLVSYVSTSAALPLAAVLLAEGVSPGAGLAFLLAGPMANTATFRALLKTYGRPAAIGFGLFVVGLAIGSGLLVNAVAPSFTLPPLVRLGDRGAGAWRLVCLSAVILLFASSLWRQGIRQFMRALSFRAPGAEEHVHAHAH